MSGPSVKLASSWLDSDHIEDLPADVILLMVSALGWSADQTTDGIVPRRQFRKFWPVPDVDEAIASLVKAGEVEDQGERVLFVNWRDFIMEADEVEKLRATSRERTERSRRHQRGDHSMCRPQWCRAASQSRDTSRHVTRDRDGTVRGSDGDPIRPDPLLPDLSGGEEGSGRETSAGLRSAGAPRRPAEPPPIGITSSSRLTADNSDIYDAGHTEITIASTEPLEELQGHAWPAACGHVAQVLEIVRDDLALKVKAARSKCDCDDYDDTVGCGVTAHLQSIHEDPTGGYEAAGPELLVMVPTGDFIRWQGKINASIKNAVALATDWSEAAWAQ